MATFGKVYIVNLDSIGSRCGFGDGTTLAQAQANALSYARHSYPSGNARLSETGREVYVNAGA